MKATRRTLLGILFAVAVGASCGRDTSLTAPAPANDLLGTTLSTVTNVTGTLLKCKKLPYASNSAWIGKAGGTLQVGPHTLTIPKGALSTTVLISGEAPVDNTRRVNLYPEGLQFATPASLTLDYSQCSLVVGLLPRVAYIDDNQSILTYLPSVNDLSDQTVTGQIPHFSGYATAW